MPASLSLEKCGLPQCWATVSAVVAACSAGAFAYFKRTSHKRRRWHTVCVVWAALFIRLAFQRRRRRQKQELLAGPAPSKDDASPKDDQVVSFIESGTIKRRQLTGGMPSSPSSVKPTSMLRQVSGDENRCIYGLGRYSQSSRVLICMVGLPARGKSYINKMLIRYLQWIGFPVKTFNAGNLRREQGMAGATADFFAEDKEKGKMRDQIALACMEQAIGWLREQTSVCVAIFDATNTTRRRRAEILQRCRGSSGITVVFVESICDDPEILEANYQMKLDNDDYRGTDPAVARADFLKRVQAYEQRYETIDDSEGDGDITYIKLFNVGRKVVMHNVSGYLTSQLGFYLSNIHITRRSIWLARHAENEDEVQGILGPTSGSLTADGKRHARALSAYVRRRRGEMPPGDWHSEGATDGVGADGLGPLLVLIGTAPVHLATLAAAFPRNSQDSGEIVPMTTSLLNELGGGDLHGMTYSRIKSEHAALWEERQADKLRFRYPGPGGESYADVVGRLQPIIVELERQRRSVLVVCHLAVQRCLYAYFTGTPMEEMPYLDMDPRHSVCELRIGPHGCQEHRQILESDMACQ